MGMDPAAPARSNWARKTGGWFLITAGIAGCVLPVIPGIPLFPVLFLSQVLNGLLLPFVLIFMCLLINKHELMGEYVNGGIWNGGSQPPRNMMVPMAHMVAIAVYSPSISIM